MPPQCAPSRWACLTLVSAKTTPTSATSRSAPTGRIRTASPTASATAPLLLASSAAAMTPAPGLHQTSSSTRSRCGPLLWGGPRTSALRAAGAPPQLDGAPHSARRGPSLPGRPAPPRPAPPQVFTDDQVSYTSWFLDAFNYAMEVGRPGAATAGRAGPARLPQPAEASWLQRPVMPRRAS
jgi:hypothetical protein